MALGSTPAGYAAADQSSWTAMLDTLEWGLEVTEEGQLG